MTHKKIFVLAYLKEFYRREDGVVSVLFALLIPFVFIPILAVSSELGLRTMEQRKLQQQADMAAYSAAVALGPDDPNHEDPVGGQCPKQIALQGGYLAALNSGYTWLDESTAGQLKCTPGQLDEIIAIDANTGDLCGIPAADLGNITYLCVRP